MSLGIAGLVLIIFAVSAVVVFWPSKPGVTETALQTIALMQSDPEGWGFKSDEAGDRVIYMATGFAVDIGEPLGWCQPGWAMSKADHEAVTDAIMDLMAAQLRLTRELTGEVVTFKSRGDFHNGQMVAVGSDGLVEEVS